jgi:hypothetical protein
MTALAKIMEPVARHLLGEPNKALSSKIEWRYGNKGSFKINLKEGFWHDFSTGDKGGVISLIVRERKSEPRDVSRWLKESLGIELGDRETHVRAALQSTVQIGQLEKTVGRDGKGRPAKLASIEKSNKNGPFALKLWGQSEPLYGTLGENYLVEHRKLDIRGLDLFHVLRYHAGIRAVVALMTDPVTAEPSGVHRIFLKSDGSKIDRRMLGQEGIVRLSQDAEVTFGLGISDSIEDALAVLLSGWRPVWACTADGGISKFPVLSGIDTLTIFPDSDESGMKAAKACGERWREARRECVIVQPNGGTDG